MHTRSHPVCLQAGVIVLTASVWRLLSTSCGQGKGPREAKRALEWVECTLCPGCPQGDPASWASLSSSPSRSA